MRSSRSPYATSVRSERRFSPPRQGRPKPVLTARRQDAAPNQPLHGNQGKLGPLSGPDPRRHGGSD
eukprot:414967-Alexandrium_andersonii.AAC.1